MRDEAIEFPKKQKKKKKKKKKREEEGKSYPRRGKRREEQGRRFRLESRRVSRLTARRVSPPIPAVSPRLTPGSKVNPKQNHVSQAGNWNEGSSDSKP